MVDQLDPRRPYQKRLSSLDKERSTWVPHWRDISYVVRPRSGRFLSADRNKGTKKNGNIIDSTGTFASRTLASGMMDGITSPARPWFRLGTSDPGLMKYGPVRTWLSDVERILREVFARSNFYNSIHQVYRELGDYGTANMAILEDFDDVIRCQTHTIGSYMVATDHKGRVNAMYREFDMQVGQLVSDYGEDKVSQPVQEAYNNHKLDDWITVVHLIETNPRPVAGSPLAKNKPVISKHYEKNSHDPVFLRESGFDEFPNMVPRWEVIGGDSYGSDCPGMTALGDIRQLQAEQREKGKGIARHVDPPMQGPTSLRGQGASTLPGSLTFIDTSQGNQQFKPTFQVNPDLQYLNMDIQEVQERIRTAYYADLFLMISNMAGIQPRNDLEMATRNEEKLIMLGPVLSRLNDELLDTSIDRVFAISNRAGILPEPPPEIEAGSDIKIDYISVLAQAQKSIGTSVIERYMAFAGQAAAAQANAGGTPDAMDKVDIDQALDEYGDMLGVPPRIIPSDTAVEAKREERAQMQQLQQQTVMAQQAADAAVTASNAKTGDDEDNLLTDMIKGSAAAQRGV